MEICLTGGAKEVGGKLDILAAFCISVPGPNYPTLFPGVNLGAGNPPLKPDTSGEREDKRDTSDERACNETSNATKNGVTLYMLDAVSEALPYLSENMRLHAEAFLLSALKSLEEDFGGKVTFSFKSFDRCVALRNRMKIALENLRQHPDSADWQATVAADEDQLLRNNCGPYLGRVK